MSEEGVAADSMSHNIVINAFAQASRGIAESLPGDHARAGMTPWTSDGRSASLSADSDANDTETIETRKREPELQQRQQHTT